MNDTLRNVLLGAVGLVALLALSIGVNYVIGGGIGEPCSDSYRCRGYLVAGAQCLNADGMYYCSSTCETDEDCPQGWSCATAARTMNNMATSSTLDVCTRNSWDCKTDADCGPGWSCKATPGFDTSSCYPAP